jgi:hypothetical protein
MRGENRPAALIVSHDPVVVTAADRRFHLTEGNLSAAEEMSAGSAR